jgi:hypothetical protein
LKKTACILLVVLFNLSCNKSFAQLVSENFEVRTILIGFTDKQEKKIQSASRLIKKIVRSEKFKQKVLGHTWKGKEQFAENRGLSNSEIYKKILEGSEQISNDGANNTMDLEIELYADYSSITIGYTYPSITRIFMNRKYFNKFRPHQVADNMMHEWLHKIGFSHAVKDTPERIYSVPYAIGYIVKGIAREMKKSRLLKDLEVIAEQTRSHQ